MGDGIATLLRSGERPFLRPARPLSVRSVPAPSGRWLHVPGRRRLPVTLPPVRTLCGGSGVGTSAESSDEPEATSQALGHWPVSLRRGLGIGQVKGNELICSVTGSRLSSASCGTSSTCLASMSLLPPSLPADSGWCVARPRDVEPDRCRKPRGSVGACSGHHARIGRVTRRSLPA